MTSFSIPSSILEQVVKLNGDNWHTWQSQIMMAFQSNESDEIVAGTEKEPPANKADKLKDWKRKNKRAVTYMWSRIEPEWQHLVLGETHGSIAFVKLKKQFKASNFSRRVALRKAFYGVTHNTSQPIEIYIRSVVNAKSQLEAIGIKVDDDALKDVVLMNLDESFSGIRTSLLTQLTEPSFDTICSVLSSSTHMVHSDIPTKLEDYAMAAKFKRSGGRKDRRSPGRGDSSGNWRDHSEGGIKDEKGYRWCDTTNDHHCHCCGHTGHNAAHCTAEMPPEIKAWVLGSPGKEEHMMYVPNTPFHHSRSPPLSKCSPSPIGTHLISFISKSRSALPDSDYCDSS
jgi:gag-polypeptide of LTR copia-type